MVLPNSHISRRMRGYVPPLKERANKGYSLVLDKISLLKSTLSKSLAVGVARENLELRRNYQETGRIGKRSPSNYILTEFILSPESLAYGEMEAGMHFEEENRSLSNSQNNDFGIPVVDRGGKIFLVKAPKTRKRRQFSELECQAFGIAPNQEGFLSRFLNSKS